MVVALDEYIALDHKNSAAIVRAHKRFLMFSQLNVEFHNVSPAGVAALGRL